MGSERSEYKQVIIVREDLQLSKGKLAVQVAHAAILGYEISDRSTREKWKLEGQKKIVLKVKNLENLMRIFDMARKNGLPSAYVKDAGLTEIPPGTITAVVIGPERSDRIDKITGSLPLLK
ncbi:peptidyl-tRNA hydrolase Pth2 [Geoglobus acetivorans]|uniref:Peptidyl-tRNA hydrolase n=1 Tax=Geoglobus acetivorans TaxID=565033 RepID=A0ABZ3H6L0_GEOAI|nr:peptidyl-tRNA hydrolase [Geoglobus acetivorans]